jgi:hypothetical protein
MSHIVNFSDYAAFPQYQVANMIRTPPDAFVDQTTSQLTRVIEPISFPEQLVLITQGLPPVAPTSVFKQTAFPSIVSLQVNPPYDLAQPQYQTAIASQATPSCLNTFGQTGTFWPYSYYAK